MRRAVPMASMAVLLSIALAAKRSAKRPPRTAEIRVEPGIDFEAHHVVYHVTVRNRGPSTFRDVVITPRVLHGAFMIDEPPKAVPALKPGTFGTASWRVVARGEPGVVELGGRVRYPDPETGEPREAPVSPVRVDLSPPALRPVYIAPETLRERASRSLSVQDAFGLPMPAEDAFPRLQEALAAIGLERVEAAAHGDADGFVGRLSFHGLDARRNSYAVRAVVARRGTASSLRLHAFVQAEERLFGFYWRVRDAVARALGLTSRTAP